MYPLGIVLTTIITIIWATGVVISVVVAICLMFDNYDKNAQQLGKQLFLTCLIWPLTGLAAIVRKMKEIN